MRWEIRSPPARSPTAQSNLESPGMERPVWQFALPASRQLRKQPRLCKHCAALVRRRTPSLFRRGYSSHQRFEPWIAAQIVQHWINFYAKKVVGLLFPVGMVELFDRAVFITQTDLNKR